MGGVMLGAVMQDQDARLNALIFWRGHGHCTHSACLFVFLDPAAHMLVHQCSHLSRPTFDPRAGGFAFLQGHDELGALAVSDIEYGRFPGVKRGHSGPARKRCFLDSLLTSGQGRWASVQGCTLPTLEFLVGSSCGWGSC